MKFSSKYIFGNSEIFVLGVFLEFCPKLLTKEIIPGTWSTFDAFISFLLGVVTFQPMHMQLIAVLPGKTIGT